MSDDSGSRRTGLRVRAWISNEPSAALPLFVLLWPLLALGSSHPTVPYSLYVQAVKRSSAR